MEQVYQKKQAPRRVPVLKFSGGWKLLVVMAAILFLGTEAYAQGVSQAADVTGIVTGADDSQPLAGVNVRIKGTVIGTVTGDDGRFSLKAAPGATLRFTYIGYDAADRVVRGAEAINVSLSRNFSNIDQVVVVGYGTMKKRDLSSAQVSISAEDIDKTVNTTIEQALQGRAAGVYVTQNSGQPGGGISVNIRGISTLNGSTEPLYVIDGVQLQPDRVAYGNTSSIDPLAGLNPADIQSIDILEGPSATALYGSRGTNGVVLITTKRGKAGQLKIGYDYLYSLQDEPDFLATMTLPQYAEMENAIRRLTVGGTGRPEFADSSILGRGTNWQEALFKTAPMQKHQLTLSGGSEKTTFYLSGEYFTQEGVAIGSDFNRYSVRLNLDNQTRKWLKISSNLSFSGTKEKLGSTSQDVIRQAITMPPFVAVRNAKGEWGGADETNSGGSGSILQFTPVNPVAIANLIQNNLKRYKGLGGITADVTLLKGLIFRASFNGSVDWSTGSYFVPSYHIGTLAVSTPSLSLNNSTSTYWNLNELLQYNTKIGKHEIGLMASHEAQESRYSGLSGSRSGFVSNEVISLPVGNPQGQSNGSNKGSWAMESYLARVNYTYNNKYILQGAFRADGSVNFAPANRWGYFPSVSAAWRISEEPFMKTVSWIDELKLRVETGLTGNQGSGQGYYAPLATNTTPWGTGFYVSKFANADLQWEQTQTNNIGFNLNMFNNRVQLEGDYYIKKTSNLLMILPEPAYMGTSGNGSIAAPTVNIGALENRGFGITLNTVNIDNPNGLSWRTNFNISSFKTKITEFYNPSAVLNRQTWYIGPGGGFIERSVIGGAPWLFYGYIEEGLFQSVKEIESSAVPTKSDGVTRLDTDPGGVWIGDIKYKDLNGDGIIDYRDQTLIGNPWPKLTGGMTNTFSYKGFDLSILFTGSYGNDIYNFLRFENTNPNNINIGRNMLAETFGYARVTNDDDPVFSNPGTMVPRIANNDPNGNGNRLTNAFVEDGSYLRVKNITLTYTVPTSVLSKLHVVRGAHLSVGVQNLYTFTKYKGYDPEVGAYVGQNVASDNQLIGVDVGRYPLTRVYTFNIGVDF